MHSATCIAFLKKLLVDVVVKVLYAVLRTKNGFVDAVSCTANPVYIPSVVTLALNPLVPAFKQAHHVLNPHVHHRALDLFKLRVVFPVANLVLELRKVVVACVCVALSVAALAS